MVGLLRRFALPPTAVIPRHRVSPSASPMTGSSGVSSTPRPLRLAEKPRNTGSSGFADDDVKMDVIARLDRAIQYSET